MAMPFFLSAPLAATKAINSGGRGAYFFDLSLYQDIPMNEVNKTLLYWRRFPRPDWGFGRRKVWFRTRPRLGGWHLYQRCRHKVNSGFMIATPVEAVSEPPLQFGVLFV
jgi:hypothetical protein